MLGDKPSPESALTAVPSLQPPGSCGQFTVTECPANTAKEGFNLAHGLKDAVTHGLDGSVVTLRQLTPLCQEVER